MKILRKLYNWWYRKAMREDPVKVANHLRWLNSQTPGQNWVPLVGFNAITTAFYNEKGQLIYNPNYGTPLKAFVNQATGEIRSFDARYFYAA